MLNLFLHLPDILEFLCWMIAGALVSVVFLAGYRIAKAIKR